MIEALTIFSVASATIALIYLIELFVTPAIKRWLKRREIRRDLKAQWERERKRQRECSHTKILPEGREVSTFCGPQAHNGGTYICVNCRLITTDPPELPTIGDVLYAEWEVEDDDLPEEKDL